MKLLLAVSFCFALCNIQAEEQTPPPVTVQLDEFFSPHASSPTLLSLHDGIRRGGNHYIEQNFNLSDSKLNRCMELGFFYLPVSYLTTVFQHEVSGHGFRLRSFKKDVAEVKQYTFKLPPPFGEGGAATHYVVTKQFTALHDNLCSTGGVEATSILAHNVRMKWLKDSSIDAKENLLHLFAHHDLSNYAFSLFFTDEAKAPKGHDLIAYKQSLHKLNPQTKITKNHLAFLSFINYVNPFDFLAWSAMHNYAATGQRATPLSMLKVKNVSMLPMMRISLAPYGPELFAENYMYIGKHPIYSYVKGGLLGESHYSGLGFEHPTLLKIKNHTIGLNGHFWHHPLLNENQRSKIGAACSATYNYQLNETPWSMQMEVGHKMEGFLPGHPLDAAPILRGALSLKI